MLKIWSEVQEKEENKIWVIFAEFNGKVKHCAFDSGLAENKEEIKYIIPAIPILIKKLLEEEKVGSAI